MEYEEEIELDAISPIPNLTQQNIDLKTTEDEGSLENSVSMSAAKKRRMPRQAKSINVSSEHKQYSSHKNIVAPNNQML